MLSDKHPEPLNPLSKAIFRQVPLIEVEIPVEPLTHKTPVQESLE